MTDRRVTLRDTRDSSGSRHVTVALLPDGGIRFVGRDFGVDEFFGSGMSEYEWVWTLPPDSASALLSTLGGTDVLDAVAGRFSGDAAGDVAGFLEDHAIAYESWSRIGD